MYRIVECGLRVLSVRQGYVQRNKELSSVSLVIVFVITFIQSIYNYIPKTNHVSTVHSATPVLQLQFMLHVMLFPMLNVLYLYLYLYISTLHSQCAVPNMAVFCSVLI